MSRACSRWGCLVRDLGRPAALSLLLGLALSPCAASALVISSFSPAGGPPGTLVSIRGTGFTGTTAVQFNGIPTIFSFQSDSLILTDVPSSAATGPIRVFVGVASATGPSNFFVGSAPNIFGFSPAGGTPGVLVTINGNQFVGITFVRFNGVSASFTVNSNSQIVATVPAGAATAPITVSNPAGTSSSVPFYFPPIISSVSPTGGVPGTPVTINGVNFSLVSQVTFNGVGAGYSTQSDSRIVTTIPGGATTGPLMVTSSAGSGSIGFFVGAAPTIDALTPAGGPAGTPVVVTGTNFVGITSVEFGGVSAAFSVEDAGTLTATVPGGATTGFVTVNNPAGTASSANPFFVGDAPIVSGFSPGSGPVGSTVSITGAHFSGATQVRFGGNVSASSFAVNNDASITAVVPPFAVPGPVTVINPVGSGVSVQVFNISPRILSFTPPSAPAASAAGTPVAISGYNLSSVYDVQFNGVSAGFTPVDDQHITALVPTGATTGPITLVSLFGNAVSPFPFEIVQFTVPPLVPGVVWPHWPDINVPVATGPQDQLAIAMAADSSGGSFVVWEEYNGLDYDIRLQHLDAFGQRAPGWPAGGIAVADTVGHQRNARMVGDQVGGVILVWEDNRSGGQDLYAARITGAGQRAIGWTPQGVPVSAAFNTQQVPNLCSDGASGAFLVWQDFRNGGGDIYTQHLRADGSVPPDWAANGVPACTYPSHEQAPAIMRDTEGGIYVAWADTRFGGPFPFLQRLQANGLVASGWAANGVVVSFFGTYYSITLLPAPAGDALVAFMDSRPIVHRMKSSAIPDPTWPTNGRVLSTFGGGGQQLAAASDGQGGAYVCWMQGGNGQDIYANHVTAGSTVASGWTPAGVAVAALAGEQLTPVLVGDSQGGAFVSWYDSRNGDYDIYASRLLPNLPTAPGWIVNGAPVSQVSFSTQSVPAMTADGLGGAVIAWHDTRNVTSYDIYTQNLTGSSRLGNPEPTLLSVADVPTDQGGKVRIRWAPSFLDSLPLIDIATYGIWRQITEDLLRAAEKNGATVLSSVSAGDVVGPGVYRRIAIGNSFTYWEGLGSVPARGQVLYSFVASTLADSTAAGPADELYMVDAHAQFGPYFWETEPGTAHSVDNLPPSAPQGFVGSYGGGTTALHWHPNSERDLAGYRIHRGSDAYFVPSDVTVLAQVTDTTYSDTDGGLAFYKVEAVDVHGNRGAVAVVVPPALAGAGAGSGIARAEFGAPYPNPMTQGTRFQLRLPMAQHVNVEIFDASGRVQRQLVAGVLPAGETPLLWDLRDASGREVAAGLYFARARTSGLDMRRRLVVVR